MAKLSRIQKYADLRNDISNAREKTLDDNRSVNHYEDKLKKLESFFNSDSKADIQNNDYIPPEPVKENVQEAQAEETIIDNKKTIDDMLNSIIGSFDSAKEQVKEMPDIISKEKREEIINGAKENKEIHEEKVATKEDDIFMDVYNNSDETKESETEVIDGEIVETSEKENEPEQKEEVKAESFVVPHKEEVKIIDIENEVVQIGTIIDDVNKEYGKPAVITYKPKEEEKVAEVEEKPVEETIINVQEASATIKDFTNEVASSLMSVINEINDIKSEGGSEKVEISQEKKNSDFVDNTIEEVKNYNKNEGKTTLEDISNALVDEVRHSIDNEIKNRAIDAEFNDTVSMEINKVLEEIKTQKSESTIIDNALNNENNAAEFDTQRAFENAQTNLDTFNIEKVKEITGEQPVVEIKNISETMNHSLVNSDVLDDTIPFIMDKENETEEVEEDDDKASPILNIILAVLIVVLLAVLAVFVYYILVARGIIE